MADLYADDAAFDPIKVSYDRPTILGMAGDVRGKRVLDVGCASGGLTEAFVERGATVVGIDLNPRLIERARERLWSKLSSTSPTSRLRCRSSKRTRSTWS